MSLLQHKLHRAARADTPLALAGEKNAEHRKGVCAENLPLR